jgi:single-stranded DNA-binding protein
MPTTLQITAVGHAYGPAELKTNAHGKQYAQIRMWVSENTGKKGPDGKPEKKFTSISAFVNGNEAEWLSKSCKKGSLILLAGSARIDSFKKQDGTESHSILVSRVSTCRVLDRDDVQGAETQEIRRPAATGETIGRDGLRVNPPAIGGGAGDLDDAPFGPRMFP